MLILTKAQLRRAFEDMWDSHMETYLRVNSLDEIIAEEVNRQLERALRTEAVATRLSSAAGMFRTAMEDKVNSTEFLHKIVGRLRALQLPGNQ